MSHAQLTPNKLPESKQSFHGERLSDKLHLDG